MKVEEYFRRKAKLVNQLNSLIKVRDNIKEALKAEKEIYVDFKETFNGRINFKILIYNKDKKLLKTLKVDKEVYYFLKSLGDEIYLDNDDYILLETIINQKIENIKESLELLKDIIKITAL